MPQDKDHQIIYVWGYDVAGYRYLEEPQRKTEKVQSISARRGDLSTGLGSGTALSGLLGELLLTATPAAKRRSISFCTQSLLGTRTESEVKYPGRGNILPVVQITVCLGSLSAKVGQVAGEKEVVLGGDSEGVAHEGSGVDNQGTGHGSGDTTRRRYQHNGCEIIRVKRETQ